MSTDPKSPENPGSSPQDSGEMGAGRVEREYVGQMPTQFSSGDGGDAGSGAGSVNPSTSEAASPASAPKASSASPETQAPGNPAPGNPAPAGNSAGRGGNAPPADEQLIQQTKNQIRNLVNEIQQLSQSECSIEEFYEGFLSRVTSALASTGGAIWKVNENGRLELQFQINVAATELAGNEEAQVSHDLLLRKIVESNEPALVQPNSGSGEADDAANPTSCLLVIDRLVVDQKVVGLVEVFQRAGSGPTTQRGYLRFLVQMCEIASDFLKTRKIRTYQQQQELWEKLEQFIRASHHGLDPKQTAYTIVNEARRLIDCDRVSFANRKGSKYQIEVVSGLDSIDRRADEIKKLGELASAVVRGEKELWYNGETEDLPPQIEHRLQEYVDRSHSKVVCVIPIRETHRDDIIEEPEAAAAKQNKEVLGALVVERLGDSRIDGSFRKRVEVVSAHASDALTNSIKHHSVFLMPVWQAIGRTKVFSRAAVPRWIVVLSILFVIGGLLAFLPWNFELSAEGKLTPQTRYEIYAPYDGEVVNLIKPDKGKRLLVDANQTLVQLNSDTLRGELIDLNGQIAEARRMIGSAEDKLRTPELTVVQRLRLEQEITTNYVRVQGLRREAQLIQDRIQKLTVTSPGAGRIVDWQLNDKLMGRQVSRGENLMTVVDESGEWVIELEMLEKKFGHLARATEKIDERLKVTFVLASLPNEKFTGELISVDEKSDVRNQEGNVVLLRVKFNKQDIPPELLLYGTRVTARIYCGQRSLGYVLFREVYETIQRNVFFWF